MSEMYLPSEGFLQTYHMELVDDATCWWLNAAVYSAADLRDPWAVATEMVTYIPSLVVWRGLAALGRVIWRHHKLQQRILVEAVENPHCVDAGYD